VIQLPLYIIADGPLTLSG